jgi:hypothetical protein
MNAPGRGHNGLAALASWQELEPAIPAIVATMRRYLEQIGCILRPGSVRKYRPGASRLRRFPRPDRTRGDQPRPGDPPPHRGL